MRRTILAFSAALLLLPFIAQAQDRTPTTTEVIQHHTRVSATCAIVVRHSLNLLMTSSLVVSMAEGAGTAEQSANEVRAGLARLMDGDRAIGERIEQAFEVVRTEASRIGMKVEEVDAARAARMNEFDPQVPIALRNAQASGPEFYTMVLTAMRVEISQCRDWAEGARSILSAL